MKIRVPTTKNCLGLRMLCATPTSLRHMPGAHKIFRPCVKPIANEIHEFTRACTVEPVGCWQFRARRKSGWFVFFPSYFGWLTPTDPGIPQAAWAPCFPPHTHKRTRTQNQQIERRMHVQRLCFCRAQLCCGLRSRVYNTNNFAAMTKDI